MNIIFLDIDGVLNSMAYFENLKDKKYNEIDESKLPLLQKMVTENNAQLVLSSTWRYLDDTQHTECYEMWQYLINTLDKYDLKIIDKTPIINGNRPLEIKTWLENNNTQKINWVSIEDDFPEKDYIKYDLGGHLIETKFFTYSIDDGGLQEKHVKLVRELFELFG